MSRIMLTAGNELALAGSPRGSFLGSPVFGISGADTNLGQVSRADYLLTVRAVRSGFENAYTTAKRMEKLLKNSATNGLKIRRTIIGDDFVDRAFANGTAFSPSWQGFIRAPLGILAVNRKKAQKMKSGRRPQGGYPG